MQGRVAGVVVLALLLVAAGVTLLVTGLSDDQSTSARTEQQPTISVADEKATLIAQTPEPPVLHVLRASNRSELSICVDGIGVTVGDREVELVQEALREQRVRLRLAGEIGTLFDNARIVQGCPPAGALDPSRHTTGGKTGKTIMGKATSDPSPHLLHIYVVASEQFETWFGNGPVVPSYVPAAEELSCRGDQCREVTLGLYLNGFPTADELYQELLGMFPFYGG
jgi:hypothetical protein